MFGDTEVLVPYCIQTVDKFLWPFFFLIQTFKKKQRQTIHFSHPMATFSSFTLFFTTISQLTLPFKIAKYKYSTMNVCN